MLTAVLKAVKMLMSCCPKNSQDAVVLAALKTVQDAEKNHLHKDQVQRLIPIIVDIFADAAVIASSAASVEKYRQEIQFLVSKVNGINHIKWRSSADILKEEGLDIPKQKEAASFSCSTVKVNLLTYTT
jgi:23S rRNA G2069 N7-methylase RlmK/C1962 C5-methylase RlmI